MDVPPALCFNCCCCSPCFCIGSLLSYRKLPGVPQEAKKDGIDFLQAINHQHPRQKACGRLSAPHFSMDRLHSEPPGRSWWNWPLPGLGLSTEGDCLSRANVQSLSTPASCFCLISSTAVTANGSTCSQGGGRKEQRGVGTTSWLQVSCPSSSCWFQQRPGEVLRPAFLLRGFTHRVEPSPWESGLRPAVLLSFGVLLRYDRQGRLLRPTSAELLASSSSRASSTRSILAPGLFPSSPRHVKETAAKPAVGSELGTVQMISGELRCLRRWVLGLSSRIGPCFPECLPHGELLPTLSVLVEGQGAVSVAQGSPCPSQCHRL